LKNETVKMVEAAQAGDVESLGRLYDRYYPTMGWLAYSVVLDQEQASDIAQETFAVACRQLVHLKKPERFSGWLATICRNLAIDTLRRRKGNGVSLDDIDEPVAPTPRDEDETVRQAIARLPEMDREIVVLRFFDEMSYEELQGVLGISVHAVKTASMFFFHHRGHREHREKKEKTAATASLRPLRCLW